MLTKADLLRFLTMEKACPEAKKWARSAKQEYATGIWDLCDNPYWLLWLAERACVGRKKLVEVAVALSQEVLPLVPRTETRPRIAVEAARKWTRYEATIKETEAAARDACSYVERLSVNPDGHFAEYLAASAAAITGVMVTMAAAMPYDFGVATYVNGVVERSTRAKEVSGEADIAQGRRQAADVVRQTIPWGMVEEEIGQRLDASGW